MRSLGNIRIDSKWTQQDEGMAMLSFLSSMLPSKRTPKTPLGLPQGLVRGPPLFGWLAGQPLAAMRQCSPAALACSITGPCLLQHYLACSTRLAALRPWLAALRPRP